MTINHVKKEGKGGQPGYTTGEGGGVGGEVVGRGRGRISQTQMGHNLWPDPDLWHFPAAETLLAQVAVFS